MKTAEELEKEFIELAREKTGKSVQEWIDDLETTSLTKMKETVDFIKTERGVSHMYATFIAGIFLNDGKPVHDSASLFEAHFSDRGDKRPVYDKLENVIRNSFPGVQIVPTKGYISFRDPKEFAIARINKKEIRVGMDLGAMEFDDYVEKARSLGTMPRISHMVQLYNESEVNDRLKGYVLKAHQIVNE